MKDVINRGGEKIFPAEVEQFLHKHPKVKDVQVSLVIASIHHKEALLQELQTEYRGLTGTFFPFFLSAWNLQVVGVKDDRLGEQVCACIRVAEGQHCTVEEIKAYCKDQISYFKIPHYVMFIESYPLTASGKVRFIMF